MLYLVRKSDSHLAGFFKFIRYGDFTEHLKSELTRSVVPMKFEQHSAWRHGFNQYAVRAVVTIRQLCG